MMQSIVVPVRDDAREFPRYDRGTSFIDLLQSLGVTMRDRRVADLGAGFGSIALAAAQAGASDVFAVDVQPERVEEAARRAQARGVPLHPVTANLLSPPDDLPRVDIALLIGVVEYAGLWDLDQPVDLLQRRVFETAYDMLDDGGTLIVATKNRWWPVFALRDVHTKQPLVNILPRSLADLVSRTLAGRPYRHHLHSPGGWVRLLRAAGFKSVERYVPYYSYQFPLLAVEKPSFKDLARLRQHDVPDDVRIAVCGRFPALKALGMAAAGTIGLPITHGLILKAQVQKRV